MTCTTTSSVLALRPLATLTGLLALAACSTGEEPRDPRPSLILVSLDTCRADRLGCYGAGRETSPRVDAFAAEGVLFTGCLAPSTITGPSHRSLFTGQHVTRHGIAVNDLPARSPYTLATLLGEAGWSTAAFVAGGPLARVSGLDQGFAVYEETVPTEQAKDGVLGFAVDGALEWLDGAGDEPFFLFLHGFDPHCPYVPPAETRGRWSDWYEGALDPAGRCGRTSFQPLIDAGGFGPDEARYLRDLYDEQVLAADAAFGALLDGLGERGLLEQTLVVFTSDHGESLGEHDWIGHIRLWEEETRIPLVIRFPAARWTGKIGDPVQLPDILPTVLSFLDVAPPGGVQGLDLMPRIRGEAAFLPPDRIRLTVVGDSYAVRFDDRWKIQFRLAGGRPAGRILRDLREDPGEVRNLHGTPSGRERFDELYARFESWLAGESAGDEAFRAATTGERITPEQRAALAAMGYAGGEAMTEED